MILVRKGHWGRKVVDVQTKLSRLGFDLGRTGIDGIFGLETEKAVKHFQERRSLEVDGVVGPETWGELVEASYHLGDRLLYLKEPPFRGDDVREIQATLNNLGFNAGRVSGVFVSQTGKAVREFQKNVGLPVDGIVGETTIEAMDNLRMRIRSGEITGVWDRELKVPSASPLQDRRIAIDFTQNEQAAQLGRLLGNLFEQEEVRVFYLSDAGEKLDVLKRAKVANQKEVDILISIDVGRSGKKEDRGSQCCYFATGDFFSARSKSLAELIQRELTSTLNLASQGVEGKNLTILRGTKMPAVVVKPAFITNLSDAKLLQDESFAKKVARAILAAVRCYFEGRVEIETLVW